MGAVVATIAQASVAVGQGGMSNLQRFMTHHPSTFTGGGDPMVVDHWFRQVEKVLEVMEITSYATRIRLATSWLEGESQVWWDWIKVSRDLEMMTWREFQELFMSCSWRESCKSSGVPRVETRKYDRARICS